MRVFLSWSGERSKLVAELLDEWLQCVLQALTPWMSSKDIDRGSLWFSEITDQLQNTMVGVICLTQDNKNKPWILFEAGALAKGLSSNRVCTFLIDLQPGDVANPLAQFNHTLPDKAGVWELVRTLNVTLKERALKETILEKVFDIYWPEFDHRFQEILKLAPDAHEGEARPENEILQEILASTRSLERRIRQIEYSATEVEEKVQSREVSPIRVFPSWDPQEIARRGVIRRINSLLDQDIPEERILTEILMRGLPVEVAQEEIARRKKKNTQ